MPSLTLAWRTWRLSTNNLKQRQGVCPQTVKKPFREVRRAAALRAVSRIQRHVRWIRKPCAARFPCTFSRPRRRRRREASSLWAVAQSAKRPAGVSKYKGCARPAHRTPIFAKGREARMIEQPGRKKRGSSQNQGFFNDLSAALPQWKGGALRQALANLPRTLSICCCWACSLGYQPWAAIFW